ncbi:MAG: hypothetical protein KA319_03300 [Ferruginibacter sp.]|nr:hypothetical protein [Ferruginibacter sp.]
MKNAREILFEELHFDKVLFNSQQELVNTLLTNKNSGYFRVEEDDEYRRIVNRLKTYISQLLSNSTNRNITPKFRRSLEKIIESRLDNNTSYAKQVTQRIIESLENKRKVDNKNLSTSFKNLHTDLIENITNATYVLVITTRAFDINNDNSKFSFQNFLINDLFLSLVNPDKPMKYFRFNFPLRTLCDLFWLALYKNLEKNLAQKMTSKDFIKTLYLKSLINQSIYNDFLETNEVSETDIDFVARELITYLNKNKFVHVFLVDAPIFSVPMIITNPTDLKQTNAYIILENEYRNTNINKLQVEDILTWKFFVYDRIKTQKLGLQIDYIS